MDSEATSSRNLEIGDIHVGMVIYDDTADLIGWVTNKHAWLGNIDHNDWDVEWVNGSLGAFSESTLKLLHRKFLELENA